MLLTLRQKSAEASLRSKTRAFGTMLSSGSKYDDPVQPALDDEEPCEEFDADTAAALGADLMHVPPALQAQEEDVPTYLVYDERAVRERGADGITRKALPFPAELLQPEAVGSGAERVLSAKTRRQVMEVIASERKAKQLLREDQVARKRRIAAFRRRHGGVRGVDSPANEDSAIYGDVGRRYQEQQRKRAQAKQRRAQILLRNTKDHFRDEQPPHRSTVRRLGKEVDTFERIMRLRPQSATGEPRPNMRFRARSVYTRSNQGRYDVMGLPRNGE